MKFGHEWDEMVQTTNPGWASKFLQYKVLKKGIKRIEEGDAAGVEELMVKLTEDARMDSSDGDGWDSPDVSDSEGREDADAGDGQELAGISGRMGAEAGERGRDDNKEEGKGLSTAAATEKTKVLVGKEEATTAFINLFNVEMKKINLFFLSQEEDIVIAWQALKDRVSELSSQSNGIAALDPATKESLVAAVVQLHGDVVSLEHFGRMNISACGKILKKADKKMSVRAREAVMEQVAALPFNQPHTLRHVMDGIEDILDQLNLGERSGVDVGNLPRGAAGGRLLRQLAALHSATESTAHLQKKMEEAIEERATVENAPKRPRVVT